MEQNPFKRQNQEMQLLNDAKYSPHWICGHPCHQGQPFVDTRNGSPTTIYKHWFTALHLQADVYLLHKAIWFVITSTFSMF